MYHSGGGYGWGGKSYVCQDKEHMGNLCTFDLILLWNENFPKRNSQF